MCLCGVKAQITNGQINYEVRAEQFWQSFDNDWITSDDNEVRLGLLGDGHTGGTTSWNTFGPSCSGNNSVYRWNADASSSSSGSLNLLLYSGSARNGSPANIRLQGESWEEDDSPDCSGDDDDGRWLGYYDLGIRSNTKTPSNWWGPDDVAGGGWVDEDWVVTSGVIEGDARIKSAWRFSAGASCDDPLDFGTLTPGTIYSHTNANRTAPSGSSTAVGYTNVSGNAAADVFYRFTLTSSANVTVSTNHANTNFNSYLRLYASGCGSQIAFNDDAGAGNTRSAFTTALCAGTYIVQVEGLGTAQGDFDLTVSAMELSVTAPALATTFTGGTCPADNNGSINVTLSGGLSNVRYIRLQQNRSDADAFINLAELQAFEIFTGNNVAQGKTVSYNSLHPGPFPGSELVNGITSTTDDMYHSLHAGTSEFVEVDLGGPFNLDNIRVWNRNNCCQGRASNMQLILKNASGTVIYSRQVDIHQGINGQASPTFNVLDVSWADGAATLNRTGLNLGGYTINYADAACATATHTRTLTSVNTESVVPTGITGTTVICRGGGTTLTLNGGTVGSGATAHWYSGSCGGTSVGTGNSISVSPTATTTYFVRYEGTCNNTGCASVTVTVNPLPEAFTPSVITATPLCYRGKARLSSGTSQTGVNYRLRDSNALVGPSVSGTGSALNFHTANLTAHAAAYSILATNAVTGCSLSVNVPSIAVAAPATNLAGHNDTCICYVNGDNSFVEFALSGRSILAVNPGGNNLGLVTVTEYVENSPVQIQACNTTQQQFGAVALGRHWVIRSANAPVTPVQVRLYMADADVTALAGQANTNTNTTDDVGGLATLRLNRYSGPNENGSFADNCGSGGSSQIHLGAASGPITVPATGTAIAGGSYITFSVPGFSEWWLGGGSLSPLPVKLSGFAAVCKDEKVEVSWNTASETNNDYFTLLRSPDGINWENLQQVKAAGNSNAMLQYTAYDDRPYHGLSYYRLRQTDYDGTTETFSPVGVVCAAKSADSFALYPNPANTSFTVRFTLPHHLPEGGIVLMDMTGRILAAETRAMQAGENVFTYEGVQFMPPGSYIVQIKGGGRIFYTAPLMVVR